MAGFVVLCNKLCEPMRASVHAKKFGVEVSALRKGKKIKKKLSTTDRCSPLQFMGSMHLHHFSGCLKDNIDVASVKSQLYGTIFKDDT